MLNTSWKSIVSSGSAAVLIAALGTHAFGAGASNSSNSCRELGADIAAIGLALGVVDGKVDQCNESRAVIMSALGVLDGKVDQSNRSSAAIMLSLGEIDGKIDQSNADLASVLVELQRIREDLQAQAQPNGLELQVEADLASCVSGAVQCASPILPTGVNQIPVELKVVVLRGQALVSNLDIAHFSITTAYSPRTGGGPDVTSCAVGEAGCGSPEFFVNSGTGCYQMWVHLATSNWVSGTYTLFLRVTDTEGNVGTKLVNITIGAGGGTAAPVPPPSDGPGPAHISVDPDPFQPAE